MKRIIIWSSFLATCYVIGCPFSIAKREKKIIKENLKNFIQKLKTQTNVRGGDKSKPYDLRCADLRGVDLSNRYLSYLNLSGANLDGSDIGNCKFEFVDLSNASLVGCKAQQAQFIDVILDNANFSDATLASAQFLGINKPLSAKHVNFRGANVSSMSKLSNVDLSDAVLDGSDFSNSSLNYVVMNKNTSLKKTNFTRSMFTGCTGYPKTLLHFLLEQKANPTNAFINGVYSGIPAS